MMNTSSNKPHNVNGTEKAPLTTPPEIRMNGAANEDHAESTSAGVTATAPTNTPSVDADASDVEMADKTVPVPSGDNISSHQDAAKETSNQSGGGSMIYPMNGEMNKAIIGTQDEAEPKKKRMKRWDQKAITNWTNKDVLSWIESLGSSKNYLSKVPDYIDGQELLKMEIDDIALYISKPLWRKEFMKEISLAKDKYPAAAALDDDIKENVDSSEKAPVTTPPDTTNVTVNENHAELSSAGTNTPSGDTEESADVVMADKTVPVQSGDNIASNQDAAKETSNQSGGGSMMNPMNWGITKAILGTEDEAKPKKKKIRSWDQKAITNWTNKDVVSWIESLSSFKKYASKFPDYIDGEELLKIKIDDVALFIPKPLWRKKFMKQVSLAKDKYATAAALDEDEYEDDDIKEVHNNTNSRSSSRGGKVAVNGVVGLRNLGNTCYMNTSIQILSQTPLITRYLAMRAKINHGTNNWKYPMLTAWTELCDIIYNQTKRGYGYTTASPAKIRKALGGMDTEFGAGTQDDSSRSLGYMLDALDEQIELEIKTQKYKNQNRNHRDVKAKDSFKVLRELSDIEVEDAVKQLVTDHNPNGSILRKTFDGIEQSTFQCLECTQVFQQYDTFRIVHLPVISNEITFRNINVVCNDNYYQMDEISVLDSCSVALLQYHVIQYLINEKSEKLVHYDIDTILLSQNGKITNVKNVKLSELQNMSGAIFVLVNDNKASKNSKSNLLQLNVLIGESGSKIKPNSASYSKYNPNTVHKFAINKIKAQLANKSDIDNDEHNYFVVYNDNVFSTKELKQSNFKPNMHNHGGINLMVILKVNKRNTEYCYDIANIDRFLIFEAQRRHRNASSILDALNKEKSFWDSNKSEASRMNDGEEIENEIDAKLIKISETHHVFATREKIRNGINNFMCNRFKCDVSGCRKLTNLDDCLSEYEKARIYDDTSYAYSCPHCQSGSNSKFVKITKKIVYSPPILLMHLDRYGKNTKRNYQTRQSSPSYYVGQQLMVNFGQKSYKSEILELSSKGMRIRYLCDSEKEWIPKSKYAAKLPSYRSSNSGYNGYQCGGYGSNKFGHDITYDMKLTWPQSSSDVYNLYGISNHSGSTEGGHYTATVYSSTNTRWYDISDSHVNDNCVHPLDKAADATILAYARND